MMKEGSFHRCGYALTVMAVLGVVGVAGAIQYTPVVIWPYDPCSTNSLTMTIPTAINTAGDVVGQTTEFNHDNGSIYARTFLWKDGVMTDLGRLAGATVPVARSINDIGQIVGLNLGQIVVHGWLYQNGVMTDLGGFAGDSQASSAALAINDSGNMAGSWWLGIDSGSPHAVVRRANGTITALGTLGGTYGRAWDINDSDQVVGQAQDANGVFRPFVWTSDEGMVAIPMLPGFNDPNSNPSHVIALSNRGHVAGTYGMAEPFHSFLYYKGTITDLGSYPGSSVGVEVYAVNDAGLAVGTGKNSMNTKEAFLWKDGVLYNLNAMIDPTSGVKFDTAYAINNDGVIALAGTWWGIVPLAFTLKVYTVTVEKTNADWGTVTVDPSGPFYEPNATVTVTAIPNSGRRFVKWEGDVPAGHETDNPLTLTMDSSKHVTASFGCGAGLESIFPLTAAGLIALCYVRRR